MKEFRKFPFVEVEEDFPVFSGWSSIISTLEKHLESIDKKKKILVIEYYQGVLEEETALEIVKRLQPDLVVRTNELMYEENYIRKMVYPDVTDDRVFGFMTRLNIDSYFNPEKIAANHTEIESLTEGIVLVVGTGAAFAVKNHDILVYADMARWEIQLRMRKNLVNNIGVNNKNEKDWMLLYKQAFFVDWRVCDRWKRKLMNHWDYVLDTNNQSNPKMVNGKAIIEGLDTALTRPFSVVPFFDPGPWGGQWMKEKFKLDPANENYAWCFNCVPEENSLLLKFGESVIEIPSQNLILWNAKSLLGDAVHARFGNEFPIRFDFLDTIDGGNLSLQIHPLTEYIQEKFGLHYTQDESYYILDAKPGATVYLGLKDDIDCDAMICELKEAQESGTTFDAEKHVQSWPAKKHDHFLIPAGTVHCSGKDSMVLEISATPYIFTFKLWDWGRLGMDGKPRPINIIHGENVIQWDRTSKWVKENLINRVTKVAEGDGWMEERTGLHEREFIETRRHWFTKPVLHNTNGGVNVLSLVEGDEIVVESPKAKFAPFIVRYAETFIVPASIGEYSVRPSVKNPDKKFGTIKAWVRRNA